MHAYKHLYSPKREVIDGMKFSLTRFFLDISLTVVKFPHISSFFIQVVAVKSGSPMSDIDLPLGQLRDRS